MKSISKLFLIVTILFASQLLASELSSAKDAGLIGEQANGYIGFVKPATSELKNLVKSVNAKRKAHYKKIAQSKKIALSEVAKVGGTKTISKTKKGNYIMRAGQSWTKK